jgi:hypothetical protein
MALTFEEILSDIPEAIALVPKVEMAIEKLKSTPQGVSDIMLFAADILAAAAPLAGKIEGQIKT